MVDLRALLMLGEQKVSLKGEWMKDLMWEDHLMGRLMENVKEMKTSVDVRAELMWGKPLVALMELLNLAPKKELYSAKKLKGIVLGMINLDFLLVMWMDEVCL